MERPQSQRSSIQNAYTDAPALHPNLLLSSLQVLFWLFFHPSAWRNYTARMDATLHPEFALVELNSRQWSRPALQRLLVITHVFLPLLVGAMLLVFPMPGKKAATGVVTSITSSLALSTLVTAAGGVVGGVVFGIGRGTSWNAPGTVYTLAVALAGGVLGDILGNVSTNSTGRGSDYSLARQLGGIVIGVLIGSIVVGLAAVTEAPVRTAMGALALAMTIGVMFGWRRAVVLAAAGALAYVVATTAAAGGAFAMPGIVARAVIDGAKNSLSFALPYMLARRIAGPWAGAVAGAIGIGGTRIVLSIFAWDIAPLWPTLPLGLTGILLGLTLTWWRPVVLYPLLAAWNLLLFRADRRRDGRGTSLLRWHPAFWDEYQKLHWSGLDDHLLLVMERNPAEGQVAMEYLATSRQRWATQAMQIEMDARRLESCTDIERVRSVHRGLGAGELGGTASALLRSFSRISQDVDAALHQGSSYNQRLALSAVEDKLDGLLLELTRSDERYIVRFRPIAAHWRQIVAGYVRELAEATEQRQEIDSPYVVGVPLTEQQEIFVGRTDISARIESLLLDQRRPPLLLYGQRRMGKTSLLNNLGRLLPSTVVPLFVDLQGPASSAEGHVGLLYNIARAMVDSARKQRDLPLPGLTRHSLANDPFTVFDEWLDAVEETLEHSTALLTLDEFEVLDKAITKGRFDEEAVLGMLRHMIQHRPRFKVLLAGSHTLDELQHWTSYLINVQVVEIGYLKEDEARQLVERPVKDFSLRYEPEACQRVLDLTRGHPALIQLLCAEIVALKNEQIPSIRRLASAGDVEKAVPQALNNGRFFFADIQHKQIDAAGLALLRLMASQGEEAVVNRDDLAQELPCPEDLNRTLDQLTRRELIEAVDGGFRFQVDLIRRWFVEEDN